MRRLTLSILTLCLLSTSADAAIMVCKFNRRPGQPDELIGCTVYADNMEVDYSDPSPTGPTGITPPPKVFKAPPSKGGATQQCPVPIEKRADGSVIVCGKPTDPWPCPAGKDRGYITTPEGRTKACLDPVQPSPGKRVKTVLGQTWSAFQDLVDDINGTPEQERLCRRRHGAWINGECVFKDGGGGTRDRTVGPPGGSSKKDGGANP